MLKVVRSKELSVQEQMDMEDAMRYAALEINFVDQRFPVSPRVRELVRLLPEVTHERHLTPLMLLEDRDLETVMKEIDRKALATNDLAAADNTELHFFASLLAPHILYFLFSIYSAG